jgi:hypothetical protein
MISICFRLRPQKPLQGLQHRSRDQCVVTTPERANYSPTVPNARVPEKRVMCSPLIGWRALLDVSDVSDVFYTRHPLAKLDDFGHRPVVFPAPPARIPAGRNSLSLLNSSARSLRLHPLPDQQLSDQSGGR